jgi:hypothetical protein
LHGKQHFSAMRLAKIKHLYESAVASPTPQWVASA